MVRPWGVSWHEAAEQQTEPVHEPVAGQPIVLLVPPQLSAPEQVICPVAAWLSTPPAHAARPAQVTWHVVPPHVMGPAHD
jgi:hypothetical protein